MVPRLFAEMIQQFVKLLKITQNEFYITDLIQSTAKLGTVEWIIAEADESDGSFNKLSPEISIITNIDNDHMDYYKSFDNLKSGMIQAFYQFYDQMLDQTDNEREIPAHRNQFNFLSNLAKQIADKYHVPINLPLPR